MFCLVLDMFHKTYPKDQYYFYLIFIHPISQVCRNKVIQYADDTVLYNESRKLERTIQLLNEMVRLKSWLENTNFELSILT